MWVFNLDTLEFLAVNNTAVQEFGFSQEEFLDRTISDLRPRDDIPRLLTALENIRDGFQVGGRWNLFRKNGSVMVADIRWHTLDYGKKKAILASIRDVTRLAELEQEREELLRRENRAREDAEYAANYFRSLFEAVPGRFLVLEPEDFKISAVSDSYLEITMTNRRDIRGRNLFEAFPAAPDDIDADGVRKLRASLERVKSNLQTDIMAVQRYPIRRPESQGGGFEERYWSTVNTPVLGPDGELRFIIHWVEDVTDIVTQYGKTAPDPVPDVSETIRQFPDQRKNVALDIKLRARELQIANNRLNEHEANLRTAQRLLGLGTWKLNLATGKLSWSDDVYDIYGVSPDRFGHDFDSYLALVHPEDREEMLENYQSFKQSGDDHFVFRHRIVRLDGKVIHVRGIGEITKGTSSRKLTGVVQDLSEIIAREETLSQAVNLLRIAGNAAKFGGWRVTKDPLKVVWGTQTARIHDEADDFSPTLEKAISYYTPEYQKVISTVFNDCLENGKPFDETARIITAKGKRIWIRAIGEAERDQDGKITAVQGAFQDISEFIETQAKTDELSRKLVETLEHISDAFFTLDQNWCFSYLNSQAENVLERSRHELLGKKVWDEFPAAVGSIFQTEYEKAISNNQTTRFTAAYQPLGKTFDVSAFPAPEGIAVYFRDVTERIQAEEYLKSSEERFRLVSRATNDVIWDWDLVRDIVWWNDATKTLFGYDPHVMPSDSTSWTDHIHPEDTDRVISGIHKVIQGKENNWFSEYRFFHANGSVREVVDRGFVIRDHQGKAIRMLGSMIDVTEQREIDRRLQQSQKLEAIGQLTGGVAHDFNNLLTVIIGNSEMLAEKMPTPELRKIAEMTMTAAERGAEMTNRLLSFARRQTLAPRLINVVSHIDDMADLFRRTLSANISIEIRHSRKEIQVEIDPPQFEAALLNLVINARDAMPEGGELTIETVETFLDTSDIPDDAEISPGSYVSISVTDTGTGMSPDIINNVFEPFFTTKDVGKGSGLGLSMVYGFARQSGGYCKILSHESMGTTVSLYFPIIGRQAL
ncbi:PAS domain-containing protein [Thalassospiraceae bacterium SW-3-3]|nr:PAS domain-containing protein [Thalassospiraceae bacterium SW-3-3]